MAVADVGGAGEWLAAVVWIVAAVGLVAAAARLWWRHD